MLKKEEVRGLVICVLIAICLLATCYFIHIYTIDAWSGMGSDISMRMAESGKRLASYVIHRITTELRV